MESKKDLVELSRKLSRSYVLQRRVSHAELLRRQNWIRKARSSQQSLRTKASHIKENYKANFPDNYGGVYTIRYSPLGDALATGFGAGVVQVRDPDTGELKATLRSALDANMPVMGCRFHPTHNNIFYVSCSDGCILQCDSEHCEMFRFAYEEDNEVNSLDITSDGKLMMTGGKDTALRVYDMDTRQIVQQYCRSLLDPSDDIKFHTMKIFSVRAHDTMQHIFVSGGWDASVKIWDLRVAVGCIGKIRGPHVTGDAIDLKANMLLTGSWVHRNSLQLWDLRTHSLLENLTPINRPVPTAGEFLYTAQFFDGDPYGNIVLAGGSGIKGVEAVSISDKMVVGRFPVQKTVHAVDSHGHMLAYGGMESCIYIGSFS